MGPEEVDGPSHTEAVSAQKPSGPEEFMHHASVHSCFRRAATVFHCLAPGARPAAFALGLATIPTLVVPAIADTPPTEAWTAIWNGPGNHDDAVTRIAVDVDAVYVAGSTYEPGPGGNLEDFFLLKYDLEGQLSWARRYGGQGPDAPSAMLLAAPGRVVMTGFAWDDSVHVRTLAHDADGTLLCDAWEPLSGGILSSLSPALTRDEDGNLLVAAQDGGNYLILKYAPDGTLLWRRTHDAPGDGAAGAVSVAADASNAVYVTGLANALHGYATIKLDADGALQWEQFEDGDIGSTFPWASVGVGPDGNPVVVGSPESPCGVFEVRVWKCDAATGDTLWVRSFPPDPCDSVEPVDVAIDAAGNVIVAGFGRVGGSQFHFQTLRYGPDGELHWVREFDGSGSSSDAAAAVAVDDAGNIYVTGLTTHPPQNRDFATVSYAPDGTERWQVEWGGPWGTNDGAADVAIGNGGDVFVSGVAYDPDHQIEAVTIRYTGTPAVGVSPAPPATAAAHLQLAPSPTRSTTGIRYEVPRSGTVRLSVYDVTGRRVRLLQAGTLSAGTHRIAWDGAGDDGRPLPPGAYFVRLEAPGVASTARATIVR